MPYVMPSPLILVILTSHKLIVSAIVVVIIAIAAVHMINVTILMKSLIKSKVFYLLPS